MKRIFAYLSIIIILIIIPSVWAEKVIAGDSYSFESEQFDYYSVFGNSSDMIGMNVTWENGNITLNFDYLYKPDNFTLIFFNEDKEPIVEHHYSSGDTKIIYKEKNNTIYRNQTIIKIINNTEPCPPTIVVNRSYAKEFILIIITTIAVIGLIIIKYLDKKKKEKATI